MVSIQDKITDYETATVTLTIIIVMLSVFVIVLLITLVGMKSKLDKIRALENVDNRVTGTARVNNDNLISINSDI